MCQRQKARGEHRRRRGATADDRLSVDNFHFEGRTKNQSGPPKTCARSPISSFVRLIIFNVGTLSYSCFTYAIKVASSAA